MTQSNISIGQIIFLQTETSPGALVSEGKHFPYFSSGTWDIGDFVYFETEERDMGGTKIEVAVHLQKAVLTEDNDLKSFDQLQMFSESTRGDHKIGTVSQPPFKYYNNIKAPNGYSYIGIGGNIKLNHDGLTDPNTDFGKTIHYHEAGGTTVGGMFLIVTVLLSNDDNYHP